MKQLLLLGLTITIFAILSSCAQSPPATLQTTVVATPGSPSPIPKATATPQASPALVLSSTPSSTMIPLSFSGKVSQGQKFERKIGENIEFRLLPLGLQGWYIQVRDAPGCDYSQYVTGPFHGPNSRIIVAVDFRNADNPGPNESIYASRTRPFSFVLNIADCQIAHETLDKLLWQYQYSDEEIEQARNTYEGLLKASGVLTITHMELENLTVGETPQISYLEFTVEIRPPSD